MQPKPMLRATAISLLLASSLFWLGHAQGQIFSNTNPPAVKNTDVPLSYKGRLALSVAEELSKQKKYEEALKQAENAVRTDPKSGVAHMVKAYVLDKLGDHKKAATVFNKAISLSPRNGYVRYAYANHLCDLKDFSAADESYMLAARDGSYPFAHKAYEGAADCAFKADNLQASEAHARAALAIEAANSGALTIMAQIMYRQSRYFEARAFIQRREAAGPLDAPLLQLAMQIERSAGDDRAAANYQKQLELISQAQIQPPTGEGQKKP